MRCAASSRLCTEVPHTGLETQLRFYRQAAKTVLNNIFVGQSPQILIQKALSARNQRIRQLYAAGEFMSDLSREYGISHQRISQIVHGRRC